MTNPKSRKAGKSTTRFQNDDEDGHIAGNELIVEDVADDAAVDRDVMPEREYLYLQKDEDSVTDEDCLLTTTPDSDIDGDDDDDEEEGEVSLDTCSSFSLQECIDEFKARRVRRISTQSREMPENPHHQRSKQNCAQKSDSFPADEDLINQNRSNKEHERKCKPCKNGFCYCFTSDSGDAMGGGRADSIGGVARAHHVRQIHKRSSRKSDCSQVSSAAATKVGINKINEKRRQSAPCRLKVQQLQKRDLTNSQAKLITTNASIPVTSNRDQLTAISRLETTSKDAPLIHIIQELRNNCVISEVHINKHKIQAQRSCSSNPSSQKKTHFNLEAKKSPAKVLPKATYSPQKPTAPPLDTISELESLSEPLVHCTSLDTSGKSNESNDRHRHKAGGRLLQKRLSHTNINLKPRNLNEPPPKPPRRSLGSADEKDSIVSSLASTSPSVREAERVVDEFLRSKGVAIPGGESSKEKQHRKDEKERDNKRAKERQQQLKKFTMQNDRKRENRKSYPLTQIEEKSNFQQTLPTCPSLSDIARVVDTKHANYDKNMSRQNKDKFVKERSFGWRKDEAKICDMLNYDGNANRKEFKSQSVQAEPQTIGWQIPPKIDLDTVDGGVRHNLDANISIKNTPVKTRTEQQANDTQKFIFHEQLKSFMQSPWSNKQHVNSNNNNSIHKKPKSSLKNSSRKFLNNSKKKILKLVSPKKDNKEISNPPFVVRKTPLRSIGIQTSKEEFRYESSLTPQSPPGSYFSAVQTSQPNSTPTTNEPLETNFDFNRTVHSPPKKVTKTTVTRKLNFPLNTNGGACDDTSLGKTATLTKTYRSFHSDFDQDVTLSKMGYILSNIRAKLEASDDHAVRTFMEIERREKQSTGFDCTDGFHQLRNQTRVDVHPNRNCAIVEIAHDPIYSEIEEDSMLISHSPQFDNKAGVEHFSSENNPAALYARVVKKPSRKSNNVTHPLKQDLHSSKSLANFLRDSLNSNMLKPLPPPPSKPTKASSSISAATTTVPVTALSQSLNNIRVMEQHSPPKYNRNLSKSELSLQRSDIFLENLCRSEIFIDGDGVLEHLEKIDNRDLDESYISINSLPISASPPEDEVDAPLLIDNNVSYELPDDAVTDNSITAGSQIGLNCIEPPHTTNQSTPKKAKKPATFMTKHFFDEQVTQHLSINIRSENLRSSLQQHQLFDHSNSCPTTPCKLPTIPSDAEKHGGNSCTQSLIEVSSGTINMVGGDIVNKSNPFCKVTFAGYQRLKDTLRKSLRKSKSYVKNETKRLSSSWSYPTSNPSEAPTEASHNQSERHWDTNNSSFNLDNLFAHANEEPVTQQLAKAVSICRQLPDLEISEEMVEAERLLLFSTLKRQMRRMADITHARRPGGDARKMKRFFIDSMRLPIKSDASHDLFFNYFYICSFECEGVIKSTQSVECRNHEAIFRDCGIEFNCSDLDNNTEATVRCEIFMLRLRKVSTISLEPKKPILKIPNLPMPGSASSSSSEEIVSRFRLHGSFTLKSSNFIPYEYVEIESKASDRVCLRSSSTCNITITPRTKSTNISTEILLTGRAEVRLPKCNYSGFLNVLEPYSQHNWNRRWCTLDGVYLRIWQDANDMSEFPLLLFDLRQNLQPMPLECAPREICARSRSFSLDCCITNMELDDPNSTMIVFLSAESQNDLNNWLLKLNTVFQFIGDWMK